MKRISLILAAAVLVLGLSQCKKQEQEQPSPVVSGETVAITLEVKTPAGSRIDVNTVTGEVSFEQGDVVHVGSGGQYVGTLTYKGSTFKGNLTNPALNQPLYFYFLGNKGINPQGNEVYTVDISDQTGKLPVISFAESKEAFSGQGRYTAFFLNKAALVEFELQGENNKNVRMRNGDVLHLTGLKNEVRVDFSNNVISCSEGNNNYVDANVVDATRTKVYAILLPDSNGLAEGGQGTASVVNGQKVIWEGKRPAVAAFAENELVEVKVQNVSLLAISGNFSINAAGSQVQFSPGNLQYKASAGTWRFAESQLEYRGYDNNNIAPAYDGWIDLFGWGTGYNPTETSTDPYAYSTFNDWGTAAEGDLGTSWRTLTSEEWQYVFNTRTTPSGIRYAKAVVDSVNGVILLPDDWDATTHPLDSTNIVNANYSSNTISPNDWLALEDAGAVFLPAAGGRRGTKVDYLGSIGNYWSASVYSDFFAYSVNFSDNTLLPGEHNARREYGFCVRLVCPAGN